MKEIVSRKQNIWSSFCRQMKTKNIRVQKLLEGDVGGNGEETLPVTQWSVFGIWCEEGGVKLSNTSI